MTPDGTHIVTGSTDNTARVWDANTFTELAILKGLPAPVNSLAVTPDGAHIVILFDDTVRVLELFPAGQALVANAQQVAPRCLTADQRQAYHLPPRPPRWCDSKQKWPFDIDSVVQAHRRAGRLREAIAALENAICELLYLAG